MKYLSATLLLVAAALAGCSTTAGNNGVNGTNANLRGTNTNTGYVTNSESNVKPTMPANATNIEPPSMNSHANRGTNSNANPRSNANSNMKKP